MAPARRSRTWRRRLAAAAAYAREAGDFPRARTYAGRLVALAPDDPEASVLLRSLQAPSGGAP